jgi:hypothetical protein
MFGFETHVGIGLQDSDGRQQGRQAGQKLLPREAAALAATPKRAEPETLHLTAKRVQARRIAGDRMNLEIATPLCPSNPRAFVCAASP